MGIRASKTPSLLTERTNVGDGNVSVRDAYSEQIEDLPGQTTNTPDSGKPNNRPRSTLIQSIKRTLTRKKRKCVSVDTVEGWAGREGDGLDSSTAYSRHMVFGRSRWRAAPRHSTKPAPFIRSEIRLNAVAFAMQSQSSSTPHRPNMRNPQNPNFREEVFAFPGFDATLANDPSPRGIRAANTNVTERSSRQSNPAGVHSVSLTGGAASSAQQYIDKSNEVHEALQLSRESKSFNKAFQNNLYDQLEEITPQDWNLSKELLKLSRFGWYWGQITRQEAENVLSNMPDGAFLVRDCSDGRFLFSITVRSFGRSLHTRIELSKGVIGFDGQDEGFSSVVDLIEQTMYESQSDVFCSSRAIPGSPSFPIRLTTPVSRFTQVRSLQNLCFFIVRLYNRMESLGSLPLTTSA